MRTRRQFSFRPQGEIPLLEDCLAKFWYAMAALLRQIPQRPIACILRFLVMPFGIPHHGPKDSLNREITQILTTQNDARNRLIGQIFVSSNDKDSVALLEKTFQEVNKHYLLLKRVFDAIKHNDKVQGLAEGIELALVAKIITEQEAIILRNIDALCQKVISVDDFSYDELKTYQPLKNEI